MVPVTYSDEINKNSHQISWPQMRQTMTRRKRVKHTDVYTGHLVHTHTRSPANDKRMHMCMTLMVQ